MRKSVLNMLLCLVMTMSSQGILHSQIRTIPQQKRDSVAQNARRLRAVEGLSFDSLRVDFGIVKESDAPVVAKFRFVNTGRTSLSVTSLTTSCPCLKATLSRYVLKPGESAEITAEYDQTGHPGRHDRYIYLSMAERGGGPSRLAATMMLTGVVLASDVLLEDYPYVRGYFSFNTGSLTFKAGEKSQQVLKFVNTSDSARRISFLSGLLPSGIAVSPSEVHVPAGGEASVKVSYDGGNSVHSSEKALPLLFDGAGTNRLNARIDVFIR